MAGDVLERPLVRAWQRGLKDPLLTVDGGRLLEGDVEFRRRTSDWFGHAHQRDAHYHAVILHVVLEHDATAPGDATGQPVPTLVVATEDLTEPFDALGTSAPDQCHDAARERTPSQSAPFSTAWEIGG
jgi:hypothetical protein